MTQDSLLFNIRGLSRHYRMGENVVRALDGVDLEIRQGEFITVVGSSGSGKSTLLQIIGGLDTPTSGQLCVQGRDVAAWRDGELSKLRNRRIGFVFQQFNLLHDLTVLENIALPLSYGGVPRNERMDVAKRYAEQMGLGDRLQHKPSELSGGQAQRVAIARALVSRPDVLLADEPTGNLDSATGREIVNVLLDLNRQGLTIIMVTHDPVLAEMGTRKVTMKDGRIIEDRRGGMKQTESDLGRQEEAMTDKSGLNWLDLVRIGVKEGLLTHKMRTSLTMLGIVIGVASVIAMSSLSLGSQKKQQDQIRALGANLMRIQDSRLESEAMTRARAKGSRGLSIDDMELIRTSVPGVNRIAGAREIKLNVLSDHNRLTPRVLGVVGDYLEVNNIALAEGRFFDQEDQDQGARVAVAGSGVARQIAAEGVVGRTLILGGDPYRVVGVLQDKHVDTRELEATSTTDANFDLLIPLRTLLDRTRLLEMRNEIDEIDVQMASEEALFNAGTAVRHLLDLTHAGVVDYQLVIPLDLLKQKQQARRLLDILTICIASISLVVGGIGIMNIMLASVTERIREIGIRRAVGATRRDIRDQFLAESILISVTGGVVGVILAMGVVIVTGGFLDIPIVFSPVMLGVAVAAAVGTGVVFGLYPAIKAANKQPVEALRYE